jgi:hypothetical protein
VLPQSRQASETDSQCGEMHAIDLFHEFFS